MGKATPFEGELDQFGNPTCGQSFMGGTLCSLPPKHEGFCGSDCQNCGGDWLEGTCQCYHEPEEELIVAPCKNCGQYFNEDEGAGEFAYCPDCACDRNELGHGLACHLLDLHLGPCSATPAEFGRCDNHRSGAGNRIDHARTPQCREFVSREARSPIEGPTPEELAEAYRSLGVSPPV